MKNMYAIGPILGDIIGSKYENRFDINSLNEKEVITIDNNDTFSDDTVLTFATINALLDNDFTKNYSSYLLKWVKYYPNRGYGAYFFNWVHMSKHLPYKSKGNGCLMRIMPVVYYFDSLEKMREVALTFNDVTHNSNEAERSVACFIDCLYYLKNKKNKEFIKKYVYEKYDIDLSINLYEEYKFTLLAFGTLKICLYLFINYEDFNEMCIKAIKLNGDCDTILSICCSLYEVYKGFNEELIDKVLSSLDERMIEYLNKFKEEVDKRKMNEGV